MDKDIENYPTLSRNNLLEKNCSEFGCYFCQSIIKREDIEDTCDNGETAICPKCSVDSLLPGITDTELLAKGLERWFTRESTIVS